MSDQFYVRIRGRVQGPYDNAKLRTLVRRGQLSRMHEISPDKHSWQQAAEYPDLFVQDEPVTKTTASAQAAANPETARKSAAHESALTVEAAPQEGPEWYYAQNNEQRGPVSQSQLEQLLRQSMVGATDLVWREGMAQWSPAQTIAELRSSLPTAIQGGGKLIEGVDHDTLRTLRETRPWVSFLTIAAVVFMVLLMLSGMAAVLFGVRDDEVRRVAGGLLMLAYGMVGLWGAMLLARHNAQMKRFVEKQNTATLEASLRSLKAFWMYASIVLIVVLVNVTGLVAFVIAEGLVFEN